MLKKEQQLDLFSATKPSSKPSNINKSKDKTDVKPKRKIKCNVNQKNAFRNNTVNKKDKSFSDTHVVHKSAKRAKNSSQIDLYTPVTQLHGVGKKTAQRLKKLGIKNAYDLVTYFPFRYVDYTDFTKMDMSDWQDKEQGRLCGKLVQEIQTPQWNYCKARVGYKFQNKINHVTVMFFHRNWIARKFHEGDWVQIKGTYSSQYHTITGDRIDGLGKANQSKILKSTMKPMYSTTQGLKQQNIKKLIEQVYPLVKDQLKDQMTPELRKAHHLDLFPKAVHDLQFPADLNEEQKARHTVKFDELYTYEVKVQRMKQRTTHAKGISIKFNPKLLRKFDDALPFTMTSGQIRSVKQIVLNLYAPTQMNRLLQGDVGSGKTIVSAFGILATISAGYQCALMVPTGVLAKQHAKSFAKVFKGYHVNIGLLTGETTDKERNILLKHLANGDIDLIIGTDALIQPTVKFHKLGLAVIDEQHKFGVDQRQTLIDKGKGVNALAMTATPIPRTLAITTYGDMDISIIDTLPKGRKPIITKWLRPKQFNSNVISFIKNLLSNGQQAYIVVPLVQQTKASLNSDPKHQKLDAISTYKRLSKIFKPFKVGLLHGQMDDDEKDKVMQDFASGKFNLLVSTTVIEVGMDVSDATVMVIVNADNFGLATLHQLRGRVGRNSLQSYCWLIANPKTDDGVKRMKVMERTDNGFVISQADLKLRGSGDLFGENQSGVPKFKCADVVNDTKILNEARIAAQKATVISSKNS